MLSSNLTTPSFSGLGSVRLTTPPKLCVMGDAFTGKTLMLGRLAKCPSLKYIYFFDCDNGLITIMNDSTLTEGEKAKIIPVVVDSMEGVQHLTAAIFNDAIPKVVCTSHARYQCAECIAAKAPLVTLNLKSLDPKETLLVVDSGKAITDAAIEQIRGKLPGAYKFEISDFGKLKGIVETFLRQMKQYRLPVAVPTGLERGKAEGSALEKIYPLFGSSATAPIAMMYFSDVILARVGQEGYEYVCLPKQAPAYGVGSRSGVDLKAPEVDKANPLAEFFK
jgi:hypothetical protein